MVKIRHNSLRRSRLAVSRPGNAGTPSDSAPPRVFGADQEEIFAYRVRKGYVDWERIRQNNVRETRTRAPRPRLFGADRGGLFHLLRLMTICRMQKKKKRG